VAVHELRTLRHTVNLSQQEFASVLGVPVNTFRMWDSGLRLPPPNVLVRAREVVIDHRRQHELLSLDVLATEFGMHQRTLRDAVRAGRVAVQLSTRSAFGRPIRLATRAAVLAYQQQYYRRSYSRTMRKPPRPRREDLPEDYAERVTLTRHALRLTLSEFAARVGAANKAVVYQWESGKRRPSTVFWTRIVALRDVCSMTGERGHNRPVHQSGAASVTFGRSSVRRYPGGIA
jgi:DNA-binding transcriptional regulator YiaG